MKTLHRLLVVAALLTTPPAAHAQQTAPHSGFWLGGGLGVGFNDDGPGDDAGGAGYIRMGGTLSPRWLLGGEAIGMSRDVEGVTVSQGNATFTALYYFASPGGPFVKGGVGFASYVVSEDLLGGTFTTDEEGLGLTFGAGYDLRLGRNLYLTPNVDVLLQSFDEFADATALLLTLGIGFH